MERITLHGTMLSVKGQGILITGRPGIGKSKLAASLLNRGHLLISDDATDIFVRQNSLISQSPPAIIGKLWLNNQGIINVKSHWGESSIKSQQDLNWVIHLQGFNSNQLPQKTRVSQNILTITVPTLVSNLKFSQLITFIEDLCSKKES